MARILFAVSPVWGHVNPTIAIAQRLLAQGHTVAYACHPAMGEALGRAGLTRLDGFGWGDLMVKVQRAMGTQEHRWLAIVRGVRGSPTRLYFDGLQQGVDDLVQVVRAWRPDVMAVDLLLHAAPIAAEACRVPHASVCPIILPLPSRLLPPYGFGLSRARGQDWRWRLAAAVLHRLQHSGDGTVNRVRRRLGLPEVHGTFFQPSPFLVLVFVTEAFEYARPDLPAQVYFVGPSVSERRGDTEVEFPWAWLDGRPLVYVSLGTINTGQVRVFDTVIEASRGRPWQVVVSVGRHLPLERWANAPGNVLVRPYVPQPALLGRASAVITHGGNNTVAEALAAGLPMAVAPFGADQFEAARRVVDAGVGLRLRPRRDTARGVGDVIRTLLGDPTLRANAERIARDYARCDGPGASAALILRLARERRPIERQPGQPPTVHADQVSGLA